MTLRTRQASRTRQLYNFKYKSYHFPTTEYFEIPESLFVKSQTIQSDGDRPTPYNLADISFQMKRCEMLGYKRTYADLETYPSETWPGRWELKGPVPYQNIDIGCSPEGEPSVPPEVEESATYKALQELHGDNVNLGVNIAEARESASLMVKPATTLVRSLIAFKRKQYNKALRIIGVNSKGPFKKGADNFSSAWLAYHLGIAPLANDIYHLQEAVKNIIDQKDIFDVEGTTSIPTKPYLGFARFANVDGQIDRRCKVGLSYKIADRDAFLMSSLGLTNPAEIAWELVPVSFVLDWITPIGKFLSSISKTQGLEFLHGYRTNSIKTDLDVTYWRDPFYKEGAGGGYKIKGTAMRRVPLFDTPLGGISVRTFKNDQSLAGKGITLMSLIHQAKSIRT